MDIVKIRVLPVLGVVIMLTGGCDFFENHSLLYLNLPSLPQEYSEAVSGWKITVFHENQPCETIYLDSTRTAFEVSRQREERLCLLGEVILDSGFTLRPAGLFIDGSGKNTLRFEDGPALTVLSELSLNGYLLDQFNCQRLIEEFENRQDESPWFWDLDPLVDLILKEEFSLVKLRNRPVFPVSVDWYEEQWLSEDLWIGHISSSPVNLPVGRHRFISPSLGLKKDIIVYQDGGYIIFDIQW